MLPHQLHCTPLEHSSPSGLQKYEGLEGGLEKLRATSRLHARVGFRPVKRELFRSLAEQPAIEVLEREQLLKQQIER